MYVQSVDIHGVWQSSTFYNIHMDTDMDMIWSMDLHEVWKHFTFHHIHMDMDMAPCLHTITVT